VKKTLLSGAAAIAMFLAMGASAKAADAIVDDPTTDWSGFYLGGHVGYGWADMSGAYDEEDASSQLFAEDLDLDGIVLGAHAGYNWQRDSLVFGIEGDVSFTDLDDSGGAPDPDETEEQSGDVDLLASVRGRLGIAIDDVLLYATAGVAIPSAEYEITGTSDTDGKVKFGDIGGVVGGGVEFAMTDSIRLRAEGLYYFFGESESLEHISDADTGEEAEFEDAFVVRAGVSFAF
jgi:outer membrane immunogenic protein